MKKPIDPNLENFGEELNLDLVSDNDNELTTFSLPDGDKKPEAVPNFNIEETVKEHHHHHHHHHSSNSDHASHGNHGGSGHHHSSHSGGSHHHSSSHSHSSHSSSKKKSKTNKKKIPTAGKVAIAILVLLLVLILGVVGTFFFLEYKGKSNLTSPTVTTQENYEEKITYNGHEYVYNKDVIAIAFLGVDKRDLGLEDGVIGTAGQADTNIVLTVDTKTGRAKAIAVPRDTMVEVDLYSENNIFLRNEEMQLCLSYAYGNGRDTSATNVTTSISRILRNIPIEKYFALDLNGIAPINDAVGGVTLTSLYDFPKENIKKGDEIHLATGADLSAEAYVRTRNLDSINASLNRTERQVQYIKAFAAQVVPAVLNDFSIVTRLYNTASDYSATNLTVSDATYLASLLISKGITDFETETLQGEMKPSTRIDYADVVYAEFYPDEDKLMETVLDTFYTQID